MANLLQTDVADQLDRLVAKALPDGRGLNAWTGFLRAHATLMRRLKADLEKTIGLSLGDFDVLAQLAQANGVLRMTDLADRTFSSVSAMTRRVDRLVAEGLVRRASSETDARAVLIVVTNKGVRRLTEAVPVHLRGVSDLFITRLDDEDLAALEVSLAKVTPIATSASQGST
jgi:DNA-binding MarR family transcriptional regulator